MSERVILRRSVASWVLYDLANTIFSLNIVSMYFTLFLREQVGEKRADGVVGYMTAASMGTIFVLSPLLGALTDQARRRVPFLIVSTVVCVACTLGLGRGSLWVSVVLWCLANMAYQAGLQFYDALLPEVSTPENRGWIGGIGVGVGYLGSFVGIITGMLMLQKWNMSMPALFTVTGLLFLLFALPSFFWIRERGNPRVRRFNMASVGEAFRQVRDTLGHAKQYPGLLRFLIGRVFYTDPINTVIAFMGLYVVNVATRSGRTTDEATALAQIIMLVAISLAVAGGFGWGRITDRLGPKRTLNIVLWLWIANFLLAATVGWFGLPIWLLFVVASLAGLGLGGTWCADRPYMLRLSPPERIGEFYGLYGMVGRFSAVSGPLVWALIVNQIFRGNAHHGQPVALLWLAFMVLVGYLMLRKVSDRPVFPSELTAGPSEPLGGQTHAGIIQP